MLSKIIIKQPVITEKSLARVSSNEYTFLVDRKATKFDIAKAVEEAFGVNVLMVKTITVKGKTQRVGKKRTEIEKPVKKKAVVKIKSDQKIDLFEIKGK